MTLPPSLEADERLDGAVAAAFSPAEEANNQLAMMFSICDESLAPETHVTLILRLLCGLGPAEIARAFLVETQTVDRRLHRGRTRLAELGHLHDVSDASEVRARQPSVLQALYLLFSEGYHGSDPENPLRPALCAEAIRLAELLLESAATDHVEAHALAALFWFDAARLASRLDEGGVFVPLAEQDRTRWDRSLIDRGIVHLADAATGARLGRWHLEAGIACEHTIAPSVEETDWQRIVELYDQLLALAPGPIVALNRALAVAELEGLEVGRQALLAVTDEERLSRYPFLVGRPRGHRATRRAPRRSAAAVRASRRTLEEPGRARGLPEAAGGPGAHVACRPLRFTRLARAAQSAPPARPSARQRCTSQR